MSTRVGYRLPVLLRCLVALLGGGVLALAFEPVGAAWLMPPALAALVLAVRHAHPRHAWLPGLLFGIGFCFTLLWWMRAVGTDAWLALSALEAAWFAPLGVGLAVVSRRRAWPWWSAVLWVAVETMRGGFPFGGLPWGRLAYATADTVWQAGLPWWGMTGASLLIALTGTTLAWLLVEARRRRRAAAGAVLVVTVPTLLPFLAPYQVEADGTVTVAAVQGDVPGTGTDLVAVHREVTANHVEATLDLADDVATGRVPRPDLVVWPENSTAVDPFADEGVNAGIRAASEAVAVPILVGAMVDSTRPDEVLNQGIVWRPGQGGADRYTKRHPVPYGEYIPWRGSLLPASYGKLAEIPRDMAAGTRLDPLRIDGGLVADAICFDVAYDDGIQGQIARGGQLLTVQTSNAMFINTAQIDQQFEISRLRAVETGRYVVVAATNGVSGVVSPDGRVVAAAAPRTREVLVEEVTLSSTLTPAVRMGLWPGRTAVVAGLLAVAWFLVPYRRRSARGTPTRSHDSRVAV